MLASVEHLRCRMDGFSEDPGEIVTQQDRVSGGWVLPLSFLKSQYLIPFDPQTTVLVYVHTRRAVSCFWWSITFPVCRYTFRTPDSGQ